MRRTPRTPPRRWGCRDAVGTVARLDSSHCVPFRMEGSDYLFDLARRSDSAWNQLTGGTEHTPTTVDLSAVLPVHATRAKLRVKTWSSDTGYTPSGARLLSVRPYNGSNSSWAAACPLSYIDTRFTWMDVTLGLTGGGARAIEYHFDLDTSDALKADIAVVGWHEPVS
jgi:hypothetical protein